MHYKYIRTGLRVVARAEIEFTCRYSYPVTNVFRSYEKQCHISNIMTSINKNLNVKFQINIVSIYLKNVANYYISISSNFELLSNDTPY